MGGGKADISVSGSPTEPRNDYLAMANVLPSDFAVFEDGAGEVEIIPANLPSDGTLYYFQSSYDYDTFPESDGFFGFSNSVAYDTRMATYGEVIATGDYYVSFSTNRVYSYSDNLFESYVHMCEKDLAFTYSGPLYFDTGTGPAASTVNLKPTDKNIRADTVQIFNFDLLKYMGEQNGPANTTGSYDNDGQGTLANFWDRYIYTTDGGLNWDWSNRGVKKRGEYPLGYYTTSQPQIYVGVNQLFAYGWNGEVFPNADNCMWRTYGQTSETWERGQNHLYFLEYYSDKFAPWVMTDMNSVGPATPHGWFVNGQGEYPLTGRLWRGAGPMMAYFYGDGGSYPNAGNRTFYTTDVWLMGGFTPLPFKGGGVRLLSLSDFRPWSMKASYYEGTPRQLLLGVRYDPGTTNPIWFPAVGGKGTFPHYTMYSSPGGWVWDAEDYPWTDGQGHVRYPQPTLFMDTTEQVMILAAYYNGRDEDNYQKYVSRLWLSETGGTSWTALPIIDFREILERPEYAGVVPPALIKAFYGFPYDWHFINNITHLGDEVFLIHMGNQSNTFDTIFFYTEDQGQTYHLIMGWPERNKYSGDGDWGVLLGYPWTLGFIGNPSFPDRAMLEWYPYDRIEAGYQIVGDMPYLDNKLWLEGIGEGEYDIYHKGGTNRLYNGMIRGTPDEGIDAKMVLHTQQPYPELNPWSADFAYRKEIDIVIRQAVLVGSREVASEAGFTIRAYHINSMSDKLSELQRSVFTGGTTSVDFGISIGDLPRVQGGMWFGGDGQSEGQAGSEGSPIRADNYEVLRAYCESVVGQVATGSGSAFYSDDTELADHVVLMNSPGLPQANTKPGGPPGYDTPDEISRISIRTLIGMRKIIQSLYASGWYCACFSYCPCQTDIQIDIDAKK